MHPRYIDNIIFVYWIPEWCLLFNFSWKRYHGKDQESFYSWLVFCIL